ncbi:MAG: Uma2 family endonuclease, partial [Chloroflexota bacterium]
TIGHTFVMRLETTSTRREPDVMVILNDNPYELKETLLEGPADICIEVVSPESTARDHGEKFDEYEKGGVLEYWIIDPMRKQARFNRLSENQVYELIEIGNSIYSTPLLPDLEIHVDVFWQDKLPNYMEVAAALQSMLGDNKKKDN